MFGKMFNKAAAVILTVFMLLGIVPGLDLGMSRVYAGDNLRYDIGHTGTILDPYIIDEKEDLQYLAGQINGGIKDYSGKYFKQIGDIDLTGSDWEPIGWGIFSFQGTYDGNGYKITGLKIGTVGTPDNALDDLGLFGYIKNGTLKNIYLEGTSIYSSYTSANVGGLAGKAENATIQSCYNSCTVSAGDTTSVGGIVGNISGTGSVDECFNTGSISGGGSTACIGGIAGNVDGDAVHPNDPTCMIVENCYNAGSVSGVDSIIGGIVGYLSPSNAATIECCYNTGNVSGASPYIGGVEGGNQNNYSLEVDNYFLSGTATNGIGADSDGLGGVNAIDTNATPTTDTDLKDEANYAALWDFTDIWGWAAGDNSGYPVLKAFYPLDVPANVVATPGNQSVTVSWDTVNGATGYKIYMRTAGAEYTVPAATENNGATQSTTIPGLTNGTTYYFVVRAMGNIGFGSVNSSEVNATPAVAAGAATITQVSDIGNNGNGTDLEVSFDIAADENLVDSYKIMVVKAASAGTFDLAAANAVGAGNYTSVVKTGSNIVQALAAGAKDTSGAAIQNGTAYKVFILTVADGAIATVNSLSAASSAITLANTIPAGAATITQVNDIGNNGDGRDLEVRFDKAANENLVGSYRIMVVKSASAGAFNLAAANAVGAGNYTSVVKTGSNIVQALAAGAKDTDGTAIQNGAAYEVFVLTVADGTNAGVNSLSAASSAITLVNTTPAGAATITQVSDIGNNGDGRDLEVRFNKAANENLVGSYRIMVVEAASVGTFDITAANAVGAGNYTSVVKTGANIVQALAAGAKDTDGAAIQNGAAYKVFVLTMADGTNATVNSLSAASSALTLVNTTPAGAATITQVSDIGNNGDGRDLEVRFNKAADENLMDSYKIMVVKSASAGTFDLTAANAVGAGNYTAVAKTGANIVKALAAGAKDTDGAAIQNGAAYKVFVLTVADGDNATVNSLSAASSAITLINTIPTGAATITQVSDIGDNGDGRDLEVKFDKAADENLVGSYRIMVAKSANAGTFDLTAANAVGAGNYTSVAKTGANIVQALATGAKDTDGAAIQNDTAYKVFVLTVADGTNAGINALSAASSAITLINTAPQPKSNPTPTPSATPTPSPSTTPEPTPPPVQIIVNNHVEDAATAETKKVDDKVVTTVTIDDKKIEEKLNNEGENSTVVIPVNNTADVVVGQLNGQTVKNMETKDAVLEIKTDNVTYTLPASQINIDSVSTQIGEQVELKDIKVNVSIAQPSQDTVKIVENTAHKNNYQVVVKPVDFEISCTSGSKTVDVSKFNGYVERAVAIPDDVDPSKITTGIVLNKDGTFSHVPTTVLKVDGKYYAKINSLTNSTYSVIWHPKTFADVGAHWAKDDVNDMGSRLVISGVDENTFAPDRDITRGEFAAIVVRALGLMRTGTGKDAFSDVGRNDWYYDAVSIASDYKLIAGYGDGTFKPDQVITREEAMTMISRAMAVTKLNTNMWNKDIYQTLAKYSDGSQVAAWAREAVTACITNGIVSGYDGSLMIKNDITRAETAAIVRRMLKKAGLI